MIYRSCNTCKLYGKTPARPVISMPMATRFTEKVAMDLKSWKVKYILHMIDMFTRLSISVFINRKTPEEVVECLTALDWCWLASHGGNFL